MQDISEEFPLYYGTLDGEVVNVKTNFVKQTRVNQTGVVMVNLYDGNTKRVSVQSVSRFIAKIFVPRTDPTKNTVLHIDGDRTNCAPSNLSWADLGFAIMYHKEMRSIMHHPWREEFYCIQTGERFTNIYELCQDILVRPSEIIRSIELNDKHPREEFENYTRRPYVVGDIGYGYKTVT